MQVLTLKQPWATLVAEGIKNMNLDLGKQNIEEKY